MILDRALARGADTVATLSFGEKVTRSPGECPGLTQEPMFGRKMFMA